MAGATATAGVQSAVDVNTAAQPVVPNSSMASRPHMWTWFWFIMAILVVLGFHIRVFGHPIPPAAQFP